MTGPVERVPLTDWDLEQIEQLQHWQKASIWQALHRLIAELRASRAREAELLEAFRSASDSADKWCAAEEEIAAERDLQQQRINKALAWCHEANPSPATNGDQFRDLIASLTGTETTDE